MISTINTGAMPVNALLRQQTERQAQQAEQQAQTLESQVATKRREARQADATAKRLDAEAEQAAAESSLLKITWLPLIVLNCQLKITMNA
ncbi:hypothetical protein [Alishewanella longhuensis]